MKKRASWCASGDSRKVTEPCDYSPELTPTQAAFMMRHLSDEDRARLIVDAGEAVIDLCHPETVKRLKERRG
jgi:hypothetical protein